MDTTHLQMPAFHLTLGPEGQDWCAALPMLTKRSARLVIEYTYQGAIDEAPTLPNGDPGDEPVQAEFDIHSVRSVVPLHFADPHNGAIVVLEAEFDLRPYLSTAAMIEIELRVLAQRRAQAEEDAIDAALGSRA